MDIPALIKTLPDHWRVINVGDPDDDFWDDGRDYDKPMFIRKDGLARIYFNEDEENTPQYFAVVWDEDSDGDCCESFEKAIHIADAYVKEHRNQ